MVEGFDKDAWILRAVQAGCYRVERDGRVFRKKGNGDKAWWVEQKMTTHARTGRVFFQMRFEGTTKSVLLNRVVALVHIPNPRGLPEVNHRFGELQDNGADDLEWAGRGEQERHAFAHGLKANRGSANSNAKLTVAAVEAIRAAPDALHDHARRFGVSVRAIEDVIARRSWEHV